MLMIPKTHKNCVVLKMQIKAKTIDNASNFSGCLANFVEKIRFHDDYLVTGHAS